MTGYTVHTGSNENFSQGWDVIFGKGKGKKKPETKTAKKSAVAKKPSKKSASKKK